jgi:hypothetical protein
MNERIKELEKQAWEFVDKTWNWANANNPSQATLFKAKFAELIVRECIGIVEKNESEIHYDTGMYPAYPTATVREILEHFGVEE